MGLTNEERLKEALERICGLHDVNGELWKAIADAKVLLMDIYPIEQPSFEYQWKVIPGYSNYEVSTIGEVRRAKDGTKCNNIKLYKGTMLKPALKANGYYQYALVNDAGERKDINAHRLVATAFYGECPHPKWVVCHLNHNKLDNRVENLMWGSNSMNQLQSRGHSRGIVSYKELNNA